MNDVDLTHDHSWSFIVMGIHLCHIIIILFKLLFNEIYCNCIATGTWEEQSVCVCGTLESSLCLNCSLCSVKWLFLIWNCVRSDFVLSVQWMWQAASCVTAAGDFLWQHWDRPHASDCEHMLYKNRSRIARCLIALGLILAKQNDPEMI